MGGIGSGGDRSKSTTTVGALAKWPACPKSLKNPLERAAWKALGEALTPLRTCSASDLPAAVTLSRLQARVEAWFSRGRTPPPALLSALLAWSKAFGIVPQSRRAVAPLPEPVAKKDDPLADY